MSMLQNQFIFHAAKILVTTDTATLIFNLNIRLDNRVYGY